ncbi:TIGR03618 family F420-dependent PPOX class oxidoreductase [Amycolatopsis sp.]|uniref:TIGR03618 family F420-dependent PPOX class oxidoreductase n=1 Tax=Amycolatopsis sp. TaxID=37632 RepID=UPI002620D178|nr:TIGR03618 family F420-dependent PPOX class oxidoreductase [Amycolatopsis sp.]
MGDSAYGPGDGPPPRVPDEGELARVLGEYSMGALAAVRKDGHPHLSTVAYAWDAGQRIARISTTADRAKVGMLRRDPRSALYVSTPDFMLFAVGEGDVEISPVSTVPGDATGLELLAMTPGYADPEDEAAYLKQMVADRRLVLRLHVTRLYGTSLR